MLTPLADFYTFCKQLSALACYLQEELLLMGLSRSPAGLETYSQNVHTKFPGDSKRVPGPLLYLEGPSEKLAWAC